jgi:hypothetical protein
MNDPRQRFECQVLSSFRANRMLSFDGWLPLSAVINCYGWRCVEIDTPCRNRHGIIQTGIHGAAEYQAGALEGLSGKLSNMSLNSSHGLALFLAQEHPGRCVKGVSACRIVWVVWHSLQAKKSPLSVQMLVQ